MAGFNPGAVIGGIKFVPNPAGIASLALQPPMIAEMSARAKRVEQAAKAQAPVETGAYRNSIHTVAGIEGGTAVGRVVSDVPYAHYLEFGTIDTPSFATLRRALSAAAGL